MEFIDDLIQSLFNIMDNLFWFAPDVGPRKMKKLNVSLAGLTLIILFIFICQHMYLIKI